MLCSTPAFAIGTGPSAAPGATCNTGCVHPTLTAALASLGGSSGTICVPRDSLFLTGGTLGSIPNGQIVTVVASDQTCTTPVPDDTPTVSYPVLVQNGVGFAAVTGTLTLRALRITGAGTGVTPGILVDDGTLTLDDTIMSGSLSTAIRLRNFGHLTMDNHALIADGSGTSPIWIEANSSALLQDHSTVRDNTGAVNGGAVKVQGGTLVLDDQALISGNVASAHGGAITVEGVGSVQMGPDTRLFQNEADGDGGGIHVRDDGTLDVDGEIVGNRASRGGAVWASRPDATLVFDGALIFGNTATAQGGALWGKNAHYELTGTAVAGTTGDEAIVLDGGSLIATESRLVNNARGGILAFNNALVTLNSIAAISNADAPAIAASDSDVTIGTTLNCGSALESPCNEISDNDAGAISIDNGTLTVSRTLFDNNDDVSGAGAITLKNGSDGSIDNSVLRGTRGRGIQVTSSSADLTQLTLYGGTSSAFVYQLSSTGHITNTISQNNAATPSVATGSTVDLSCVRADGFSTYGGTVNGTFTTASVTFENAPSDLRLSVTDIVAADACGAIGVRPDMLGELEVGAFDMGAYERPLATSPVSLHRVGSSSTSGELRASCFSAGIFNEVTTGQYPSTSWQSPVSLTCDTGQPITVTCRVDGEETDNLVDSIFEVTPGAQTIGCASEATYCSGAMTVPLGGMEINCDFESD